MASLPQAGQSVQPLQRQLAWSLATVLPLEVALSLEMFAVVLLVSWSLPCLLPCSFPVGLLPTGLHFARSIPVTRRAEAVTHQGTWIYPFVIFVLKFFCVEKKS